MVFSNSLLFFIVFKAYWFPVSWPCRPFSLHKYTLPCQPSPRTQDLSNWYCDYIWSISVSLNFPALEASFYCFFALRSCCLSQLDCSSSLVFAKPAESESSIFSFLPSCPLSLNGHISSKIEVERNSVSPEDWLSKPSALSTFRLLLSDLDDR